MGEAIWTFIALSFSSNVLANGFFQHAEGNLSYGSSTAMELWNLG